MKLYLDNCCFNRPYDDQTQLRILLETEAKLKIQENIRCGKYKLVWSYILDYENSKNPFFDRREHIFNWKNYAIHNVRESEKLLIVAENISRYGIKNLDSLHIACAILGEADYFLSTDDGIIKRALGIKNIEIIDPIGFIKEVAS